MSRFEQRSGTTVLANATKEENHISGLNAMFKAKTQTVFDRKSVDSQAKVTALNRLRYLQVEFSV